MIITPILPTPDEWVAMPFTEQVQTTFGLVRYVLDTFRQHLAVRQSDTRPMSAADRLALERLVAAQQAVLQSLLYLRSESDNGVPAGTLERTIQDAVDALSVIPQPIERN